MKTWDFFNLLGAALGDVETEIKNRGNIDLCIVVARTPTMIKGL